MIQGLLLKAATPVVVGFLFVATIVLGIATTVQSVRLNGFGILGWEIAEGYRPLALRLGRENTKLVANNLTLSNGLDKCNLGVKNLEIARVAFQTEAQKLVDERLRLQREYNTRIARVNALRPTDAKCPTIDTIFSTGFGR